MVCTSNAAAFMVFLFLCATAALTFGATLGDKCDFAQRYTIAELFADEAKQDQFLQEASRAEGKFARDGIGINYASGLSYDGTNIDYFSGLPLSYKLHAFSASSKEAIHASMLALALADNKYAKVFLQSSMEGVFNGTVTEYAIEMLKRKITSYEEFNKRFPGFGGYIPWYSFEKNTSLVPAWDWKDRVPALDNGEMIWGLVAAQVALEMKNEADLAKRYENYVKLLADTGLTVFLKDGGIMCVSHIRNVTAPPTPENYFRGENETCNLDDPYEGELFTIFVDLYSNWTNYGGDAAREKIWETKRVKLQPVNFTSTAGEITVEKGWWFSAHEKWKYLELPYFDSKINEAVFLNGEKARTHFSYQKSYPGLFAAVTNVSEPNTNQTYDPNYVSGAGIQEIAFEKIVTNDIVTPYGSFPLLSHKTTKPYGIAWYANMLKGGRMQGPQGSTEAINIRGDLISPTNTWDSKITSVLGFCGGIIDLTRDYLNRTGKYERFLQKIDSEWKLKFGSIDKLIGNDIGFKLPGVSYADDGLRFTACAESSTKSSPPPPSTSSPQTAASVESSTKSSPPPPSTSSPPPPSTSSPPPPSTSSPQTAASVEATTSASMPLMPYSAVFLCLSFLFSMFLFN